jgi:aminopeptidase YwaD
MPKNFPFYNPESHQRIIALLEQKRPQAIIAATTRNPQLAGAVYPFPLIEDGDFDIPSVYIKDVEGERLAAHAGREVSLEFKADRTPATGCNVIARKGTDFSRRVVLFAHIDAKQGTPGALDNGTGVVTLLLLAERLADYSGDLGIEIVALNGEDYYSAPGEQQWIARNTGKFTEIVLGINLDGAGYQHGNTAYSLYDPPPEIAVIIWEVFSGRQNMVEGDPWYQSDHSLFIQKGRPALAITSDRFDDLWTRIAHTPDDRPEIVDYAKLIDISAALLDLLRRLDGHVEQ